MKFFRKLRKILLKIEWNFFKKLSEISFKMGDIFLKTGWIFLKNR